MLMVILLSWLKDMVIQPARDMSQVREMKRRYGADTEIIAHDSNFLCPVKFDDATRQLTEEEQIEWLHLEVYPALVDEGLMTMVNGKYRYNKNIRRTN